MCSTCWSLRCCPLSLFSCCLHSVDRGKSAHLTPSPPIDLSSLVLISSSVFFLIFIRHEEPQYIYIQGKAREGWRQDFCKQLVHCSCSPEFSCSGCSENSVLQRLEKQRWWLLSAPKKALSHLFSTAWCQHTPHHHSSHWLALLETWSHLKLSGVPAWKESFCLLECLRAGCGSNLFTSFEAVALTLPSAATL